MPGGEGEGGTSVPKPVYSFGGEGAGGSPLTDNGGGDGSTTSFTCSEGGDGDGGLTPR
jgi:hypothetical protein